MYRIICKNGSNEYVLHDTRDDKTIALNPKLSLQLNKTGSLTFAIPAGHENYDKVNKLTSVIEVYQDDELIFTGRPLSDEVDFYNTGTIPCEGDLSYLIDSKQRPYEYTGDIRPFLQQLIDNHNSQVETGKLIQLGVVTVVDPNGYINRSDSGYTDTLTTINEKLIKTHGGYIRIRHDSGKRYLDYLADYGHVNTQVIRFGENLIDLKRYAKAESIRTAIIPLGAETEEEGINGTKLRVNITSVNGGKDYIFNQEAVNTWGWIWDTVEFDDVTLPENLKAKGEAYLQDCINLVNTIELTAVDMSMMDVDAEKIKLGDWIRVISAPHGLNRLFLVSKMDLDLANPGNNKITLGSTFQTLTESNNKSKNDISARIEQIARSTNTRINQAVEHATQLITGGLGGYIVLDLADDGHPQAILIMDAPDKNQAMNIIQINKNGIGFSTSGIAGPYTNAWTIDGHLVADFITVGKLFGIDIEGVNITGSNISGGEINIADNFIVDENGLTQLKNALITGGSLKLTTDSLVSPKIEVLSQNDSNTFTKIYSHFLMLARSYMGQNYAANISGNNIMLGTYNASEGTITSGVSLSADGNISAKSFEANGAHGVTGSFSTSDSKTVSVKSGIITNIT